MSDLSLTNKRSKKRFSRLRRRGNPVNDNQIYIFIFNSSYIKCEKAGVWVGNQIIPSKKNPNNTIKRSSEKKLIFFPCC